MSLFVTLYNNAERSVFAKCCSINVADSVFRSSAVRCWLFIIMLQLRLFRAQYVKKNQWYLN